MAETLLTPSQIFNLLQVRYSDILKWIESGKLKSRTKEGKRCQVSMEDLETFVGNFRFNLPADLDRMRKRILVVDDEVTLLTLLERMVKVMGRGYEVISVADGVEAIVEVTRQRPDMILLDLSMPKMDGFEVCRRLKKDPETEGIVIIAMSGLPKNQIKDKLIACQADDFFSKPLDLLKLVQKVKAYMEPS